MLFNYDDMDSFGKILFKKKKKAKHFSDMLRVVAIQIQSEENSYKKMFVLMKNRLL